MTEIDVRKLVLDAIQNKKPALLKELFETIPTIDIAEIMDDVEDVAQLMYVFRVVSADYTGDLFAELSSDQQEKIIASFSDKDLLKSLGATLKIRLIKLAGKSSMESTISSAKEFSNNLSKSLSEKLAMIFSC